MGLRRGVSNIKKDGSTSEITFSKTCTFEQTQKRFGELIPSPFEPQFCNLSWRSHMFSFVGILIRHGETPPAHPAPGGCRGQSVGLSVCGSVG